MNLQFSFYENDVRLYDVRLYDAAYIFKIYPSESKSFTLIYAQLSVQNAPALQIKS